mmetsp:Transcript_71114/g.164424  ORF Transcript_71114/g.164424 Transcript_71114/m.164424 type:complete len:236 (+) Transcript_71114:83-790(+)
MAKPQALACQIADANASDVSRDALALRTAIRQVCTSVAAVFLHPTSTLIGLVDVGATVLARIAAALAWRGAWRGATFANCEGVEHISCGRDEVRPQGREVFTEGVESKACYLALPDALVARLAMRAVAGNLVRCAHHGTCPTCDIDAIAVEGVVLECVDMAIQVEIKAVAFEHGDKVLDVHFVCGVVADDNEPIVLSHGGNLLFEPGELCPTVLGQDVVMEVASALVGGRARGEV